VETVFIPYLHREGGVHASLRIPDPTKQIHTHIDLLGVQRHYYVPDLIAMTLAEPMRYELVRYQVDAKQAGHIVAYHGIELSHLTAISSLRLDVPGIIVSFPDGTEIIVDGNHRYVKRFSLGKTAMAFWRIPEEQAKQSMLNLPQVTLLGRRRP